LIQYVPRIISALVGLSLVGAGIYLIVTGHEAEGSAVMAGGVGTLALPRMSEAAK